MLELLVSLQASIRSGLGTQIDAFALSKDYWALIGMLPLAIVFGMAHALTPGHGKSLLATYSVGSDLGRLRIVGVAMALTLTHIGSAVALALIANTLVTRTIVGAGQAPALELISSLLLLAVAAWLVFRAVVGRRHAHAEGALAGIAAGLIPCPLTLFLMFYAVSRGVPEAGLMFALAMVLGVGLVLTVVAVLSVTAKALFLRVLDKHPSSFETAVRWIDGLAGMTLLILAALPLLS